MSLLKRDFLISHPIQSGLIWAALFVSGISLVDAIRGNSTDLPALIIRALLVGIAWGYAVRWWHKRKLDPTPPG